MDLLDRFKRLDEDAHLLFDTDERFHLVIVGGSALILQQYISRATHDVDTISVSSKLFALLENYDIDSRVQAYINNFPYNYEDRLVLVFSGRKIDFFAASLEDIVVAKLYSMRPTDKSDIESKEVLMHMDWDLLERLAVADDEARASALNDRNYNDFKMSYDEYVERFRP